MNGISSYLFNAPPSNAHSTFKFYFLAYHAGALLFFTYVH